MEFRVSRPGPQEVATMFAGDRLFPTSFVPIR